MAELSKNETIKEQSRFLRGGISEGLREAITGALAEDDTQLTKFHGIYQQDDRDLRPERGRKKMEKAFSFMARVRIPGGVITPAQWLAMDTLAGERANGTLRLTTRQTIQFHGIIKSNLRPAIQAINDALLDTIAACGDVNRNVMCAVNPEQGALHRQAYDLACTLGLHMLPKTGAYHEIWLNGERVAGGEPEAEPIYGATYLPRKFKIGVAIPPRNDIDVFSQDLGFIAVVENGAIAGYDVVVGGGMGMTHGETETFPRTAEMLGFCTPDQVVAVAEKVLMVQRDFGDRVNRKHARLKYTIEDRGLAWFRAEVEARLGFALAASRPVAFAGTGDAYGWAEGEDGSWHHTVFIENGRVHDTPARRIRTGLAAIARIHAGRFRITPNQNLVIAGIRPAQRAAIEALLRDHGLLGASSGLRASAMACVALPTCGLALAESERYLPDLITALESVLDRTGLRDDEITIRMTGCPNGCARPYLAEIALVGRNPGLYNLYLGGAFDGTRLNKLYRKDVGHEAIIAALAPLLEDYAGNRRAGEHFGDFVIRAGHVRETTAGNTFHADVAA
ncbi:MAG TPA: NADPH-dependent assimilatory sulfite reductase hemoprotein subunit [Acetobacteraceae bacterium]|nr:NADPH-dependent assimilatory sulfite reductase hemoprotein subunit [Acetobacteraceae bacterium]